MAALDADREARNEPDKYQYKCICVRPILETTHSEGGVDYTARFQLCEDTGLCSLERFAGTPDTVACTGECPNKECKCTLFSLNVRDEPGEAKWKLAAKGGAQIKYEGRFYYRCFCLK